MREMHIDLDAVMAAFDFSSQDIVHYLDLETGIVVMVSEDMRIELEALYEEYWDLESDEDFNLEAVLQQSNLPDWHREALLKADAVEEYYMRRYIEIPAQTSGEGWLDMQDYIQTINDQDLKIRLWEAINGSGAFRNFKIALYDTPVEQAQWYAFKERRLRQRVLDWLASKDIVPTTTFSPAIQDALEPVRNRLLSEALAFIRDARTLAGVVRIALIGSITTDKPHPNGIDILVTITDDADLETLAALARKMAGHAQSFSSEAHVFLADIHGEYLGRTCPWRQCGPGLHEACDALHCGERQYVHDDFNTIRLSDTLVARPPIEIWPDLIARVTVPEDVELGLIAPLTLQG